MREENPLKAIAGLKHHGVRADLLVQYNWALPVLYHCHEDVKLAFGGRERTVYPLRDRAGVYRLRQVPRSVGPPAHGRPQAMGAVLAEVPGHRPSARRPRLGDRRKERRPDSSYARARGGQSAGAGAHHLYAVRVDRFPGRFSSP